MQRSSRDRSANLTPEDWCQEGLTLLAESGHAALRISAIADRLGVTYGSFYSHFRSADDYYSAFLEFWFRELLVPFARRHLAAPQPSMVDLLDDVEKSGSSAQEAAIRQWAKSYQPAANIVRKADRYRMRAMAQMLRKTGLPAEAARRRGEIMLVSYIGALDHPDLQRRELVTQALAQMIDDLGARA